MALGGLLEGRGHAKTRAQKHACNAKADEQETAAALSIKTINDNDNDNGGARDMSVEFLTPKEQVEGLDSACAKIQRKIPLFVCAGVAEELAGLSAGITFVSTRGGNYLCFHPKRPDGGIPLFPPVRVKRLGPRSRCT